MRSIAGHGAAVGLNREAPRGQPRAWLYFDMRNRDLAQLELFWYRSVEAVVGRFPPCTLDLRSKVLRKYGNDAVNILVRLTAVSSLAL